MIKYIIINQFNDGSNTMKNKRLLHTLKGIENSDRLRVMLDRRIEFLCSEDHIDNELVKDLLSTYNLLDSLVEDYNVIIEGFNIDDAVIGGQFGKNRPTVEIVRCVLEYRSKDSNSGIRHMTNSIINIINSKYDTIKSSLFVK